MIKQFSLVLRLIHLPRVPEKDLKVKCEVFLQQTNAAGRQFIAQ